MTETALRAPAPPDARARGEASPVPKVAARRKFRIQIQTELEPLPSAWGRLEANGHGSPFQTQAWLLPWYRIIAPHQAAKPLFVTVSDVDTGEPLMFFPLCTRRDETYRWIEFADLGVSDYNAPLVAAGFAPDELQMRRIMREVFAILPPADLLRFDKTPDRLEHHPNPLAGHEMFHRMRFRAWGVDLPATHKAFHEKLTKTFAGEIARKHRRLNRKGDVTLHKATTERDALTIFATLCEQRAERFKELGRTNILDNSVYRDFYETVLLSSLRTGFASVSALKCDDEIVATMFGLHCRNAFHLLMSTMQAGAWKSSSPGHLAIDQMISHMIDESGEHFDFTIGDESYKRDFGAEPTNLYECVRAQSLLGAPYAFKTNARAVIRNRLRRLS